MEQRGLDPAHIEVIARVIETPGLFDEAPDGAVWDRDEQPGELVPSVVARLLGDDLRVIEAGGHAPALLDGRSPPVRRRRCIWSGSTRHSTCLVGRRCET